MTRPILTVAAVAGDDRTEEVLAAGRCLAILAEGVVQDCGAIEGAIGAEHPDDCADCAPTRQAILDWARACGRLARERGEREARQQEAQPGEQLLRQDQVEEAQADRELLEEQVATLRGELAAQENRLAALRGVLDEAEHAVSDAFQALGLPEPAVGNMLPVLVERAKAVREELDETKASERIWVAEAGRVKAALEGYIPGKGETLAQCVALMRKRLSIDQDARQAERERLYAERDAALADQDRSRAMWGEAAAGWSETRKELGASVDLIARLRAERAEDLAAAHDRGRAAGEQAQRGEVERLAAELVQARAQATKWHRASQDADHWMVKYERQAKHAKRVEHERDEVVEQVRRIHAALDAEQVSRATIRNGGATVDERREWGRAGTSAEAWLDDWLERSGEGRS